MLSETTDRCTARILRVLLHIQDHLDEALSVAELAKVANISPYHFHRIFRGMVGEPVLEHVRRLRLERAALHLLYTDHRVARIAFDAGYETHEAFTRAFKAFFCASPSAWRRERRQVHLDTPSGVHYLARNEELHFNPLTEEVRIMDVEIVHREEERVAFVRHIGPYNEVGRAWGALCGWAGPRGLLGPEVRFLGLSHDDPDLTETGKLRYDACLPVGPEIEAEGNIGVQTIPGGAYARFRHTGPYETLSTSYAAFCDQWLPGKGYQMLDRPSLEIYLDDPDSTEPAELRTDIYIALTREE